MEEEFDGKLAPVETNMTQEEEKQHMENLLKEQREE